VPINSPLEVTLRECILFFNLVLTSLGDDSTIRLTLAHACPKSKSKNKLRSRYEAAFVMGNPERRKAKSQY